MVWLQKSEARSGLSENNKLSTSVQKREAETSKKLRSMTRELEEKTGFYWDSAKASKRSFFPFFLLTSTHPAWCGWVITTCKLVLTNGVSFSVGRGRLMSVFLRDRCVWRILKCGDEQVIHLLSMFHFCITLFILWTRGSRVFSERWTTRCPSFGFGLFWDVFFFFCKEGGTKILKMPNLVTIAVAEGRILIIRSCVQTNSPILRLIFSIRPLLMSTSMHTLAYVYSPWHSYE